jgi:signal transduction histidine kinase/CHASE3 domain sensor protein
VSAGLAAAVLVLAVGAVALWTTSRTAASARAVEHSETVLDTLDHVLSRLKDAETGQRGYLLTGDTAYLAPYRDAIRVIDQDLAALTRLTATRAAKRELPRLQALVTNRLDELEHAIALRRAGRAAAAIALVRTNLGLHTMDAIRAVVDTMERHERSLLAARARYQRATIRAAVIIIAFGSAGAFMLAVAAHLLVRRAVADQQRAEDAQRFLADASAALASSLDLETTLERVAELAVPVIADWCAVDLAQPDGSIRRVAMAHSELESAEFAARMQERYPADPHTTYGVPHAIRTREPELASDVAGSIRTSAARDAEYLQALRTMGLTSYMIVPLLARDQVLGAMTFVSAESKRHYGPRDLDVATDLARRAAVAIDNARLFHDVEESRQQLEQQATEMEAQAEELARAATRADAMNEELQRTNAELAVRTEAAEMARARAVVANRAKSDFLAVMSHELRTPLQAIIGYTDLIADGITGPVNEAQRDQLGRVQASGHHLLSLIDQILTFSRVDAGKEPVHVERVDVCNLAREAVALVEPNAHTKGIGISVHIGPRTCHIETDPTKVRQILLNLLSNAVKFTDHGEVTLTLRAEAERVTLAVRDTGVGISSENLERIFDPFWQVERMRARRIAGTGLGLSVTRKLARLLGGDVSVESEVGRGSTFTVWLPMAAPKSSAAPTDQESASSDAESA